MYGTFELTYPDVQLDLDTYGIYQKMSRWYRTVPVLFYVLHCHTLTYDSQFCDYRTFVIVTMNAGIQMTG